VPVEAVEQSRVDDQVDGVARHADDAELRQLLPVVALPQRMPEAGAQAGGDCGVPLLHVARD
jgi:hypothetical protein